jgi:hypothetical protein
VTGGVSNVAKFTFCFRRAKKNFFFKDFHTPRPLPPTYTNIVSVLHIYFLRTFQRAIVELIKRQGLKVYEETDRRTDDKVTYEAVFFQKRAKNNDSEFLISE